MRASEPYKKASPTVISVGECMLELRSDQAEQDSDNRLRYGYGGDTYNTAYAIARLGVPCRYLTVLGDDSLSDKLIRNWQLDGVDTRGVQRLPGQPPGLYWIETDAQGERRFQYWRSAAPARRLMEVPVERLKQLCHGGEFLYFSLITLAVVHDREALLQWLVAQADTHTLVYDNNYRAGLWASLDEARYWHQRALSRVGIYLPSLDDEITLSGTDKGRSLDRLADLGRECEVVAKRGCDGAWVRVGNQWRRVPAEPVSAMDTTGAGDAFNGAYVAARAQGEDPLAAACRANQLAAQVVRNPGALLPRNHPIFQPYDEHL